MKRWTRQPRSAPRRASPTADALIAVLSRARTFTPAQSWTLVLCGFAAATLIDVTLGHMLNPFLPYILTIFAAGWCIGESVGFILALSAALMMTGLHGGSFGQLHGAESAGAASVIWNTAARTITMTLFALTAGALRVAVEREAWRARTDGLTGALNKATFHQEMALLLPEIRAANGAVVLAYIDLDGFKGVNDRHGHSAGDRVLTAFAAGAAEAVRSHDLFARIGGDEFVALLAVRDCDEGDQVAEMLHDRLTRVLAATGFPVTCSMGALVCAAREVKSDDALVEHADKLMYEVKHTGKNALRIAHAGRANVPLHEAFPVRPHGAFNDLLRRIDREVPWQGRRAA